VPRILVTGASGLLGRVLKQALYVKQHDVVGLGLTRDADVRADLTKWESTQNLLDTVRPTTIINLAANTDVDYCERHPKAAYLANVRTVENIVRWLSRVRGCHLIQLSTDHVYDGDGPHSEKDAAPANCYALSKYCGEMAARQANACIVRTNFFGPSKTVGRLSFSDWIVASLKRGDAITVFDDVKFSPLTMTRLAGYLELMVRLPRSGVFNVGSLEGLTKAEFAFQIAQALRLPTGEMHSAPMGSSHRTYRPRDMRMNCAVFEREYAVQLPTLSEEILACAREVSRVPS
jgi:dTDP-4-dehydrorhamnose reductase